MPHCHKQILKVDILEGKFKSTLGILQKLCLTRKRYDENFLVWYKSEARDGTASKSSSLNEMKSDIRPRIM